MIIMLNATVSGCLVHDWLEFILDQEGCFNSLYHATCVLLMSIACRSL